MTAKCRQFAFCTCISDSSNSVQPHFGHDGIAMVCSPYFLLVRTLSFIRILQFGRIRAIMTGNTMPVVYPHTQAPNDCSVV